MLGGEIRVYDRFGTATVTVGGHTYDIARARRERYPAPGALPEVEPAPLDEDLERRDFTVNAIAIELGGPEPGSSARSRGARGPRGPAVCGCSTIAASSTTRPGCCGSRATPTGSGSRSSRSTLALARDAIAGGALRTVSGPRIGAELRLLAREPDPVKPFQASAALGLDAAIDPAFELDRRELARAGAGAAAARRRPARATVLALAVRAASPAAAPELLDTLAFEPPDRRAIVAAATRLRALAAALERATRPSEIAAAVGGAGPEQVAIAGALGPADAASDVARTLRHVELEIDGADLLAAGVAGGAGGRARAAGGARRKARRARRRVATAELSEALRAAR